MHLLSYTPVWFISLVTYVLSSWLCALTLADCFMIPDDLPLKDKAFAGCLSFSSIYLARKQVLTPAIAIPQLSDIDPCSDLRRNTPFSLLIPK